jgi:Protein of unknown function (DUF1566)
MKRSVILLAPAGAVSMLLVGALVLATPARAGQLPATGQTTAYQADKNDGISGPVDIPDDGTLQRGALLSYKVLKDGTVKDLNTGLIWEVKCSVGCGGLHDVSNTYPWSGDGTQETIWDWLDAINVENNVGYAGHNDWRIPNIRELQSIVDFGRNNPTIDPIFGPLPGPEFSYYWSSSTHVNLAGRAWIVNFDGSDTTSTLQKQECCTHVRAVRGGPK